MSVECTNQNQNIRLLIVTWIAQFRKSKQPDGILSNGCGIGLQPVKSSLLVLMFTFIMVKQTQKLNIGHLKRFFFFVLGNVPTAPPSPPSPPTPSTTSSGGHHHTTSSGGSGSGGRTTTSSGGSPTPRPTRKFNSSCCF